ncbi:MAG: ABC-F family ATP-binding cassette domain-containing protein [Clostridiales bacterium]|nr:ABC-F family ATP-binding cassette domain-containing protein [Clostridiales bacterium]
MLLTLSDISKSFQDQTVLKKISLAVNDRDRIGLLGINGIGKSTLLNIISGELEYDEGNIAYKDGLEIGYLKQSNALNEDNSLKEEINDSLKEIFDIRNKLQSISDEIAQKQDDKLLKEYDRLTNCYLACDGINAETRINTVLQGMGFASFDMNSEVRNLSGGEKTRFAICKILVRNPELLLLDEPTNHLDFEMLEWLEAYLKSYKGAVITVSHDRYFLDSVSTDICELENGELIRYKGGYSSFLVQKEERIKRLTNEYNKQQKEIEHLKDYVNRNLARSSSSNSVGSRVKALEKAEIKALPRITQKDLKIIFEYDTEPYSSVLECSDISVSVGNPPDKRVLFDNIDFSMMRGEKIAIVGKNGIGKSSFLKAILKKIPSSGRIKYGGNLKISYFEQEMDSFDMNLTAIETVHRRFPAKDDFEIRSMLARFLIQGEDVFKQMKQLSGANKAKVAFAIICFERPNLLVLDEPTNHLDYIAKQALEKALKEYNGTILMVSHDRYMLSSVPDKICELTEKGLYEYQGNYQYYREHRIHQTPVSVKTESAADNAYTRSKKNKADERKRRVRLAETERKLQSLEEEIEAINAQIQDPENSSDYIKLDELLTLLEEKKKEKDIAESQWLELSE